MYIWIFDYLNTNMKKSLSQARSQIFCNILILHNNSFQRLRGKRLGGPHRDYRAANFQWNEATESRDRLTLNPELEWPDMNVLRTIFGKKGQSILLAFALV